MFTSPFGLSTFPEYSRRLVSRCCRHGYDCSPFLLSSKRRISLAIKLAKQAKPGDLDVTPSPLGQVVTFALILFTLARSAILSRKGSRQLESAILRQRPPCASPPIIKYAVSSFHFQQPSRGKLGMEGTNRVRVADPAPVASIMKPCPRPTMHALFSF